MKGYADSSALFPIVLYCAVIAAWLPLVKLYRHTLLGPLLAVVGVFVVVGLGVLMPLALRSSREWPERVFRWHLIACGGILVALLLGLLAHALLKVAS